MTIGPLNLFPDSTLDARMDGRDLATRQGYDETAAAVLEQNVV